MSTTIRTALRVFMVAITAATLVPKAGAFYPQGFFNEFGELIIITWPIDVLDRNNDGDVNGPNDGVTLNFETGNGVDGFTTNEVAKILAGYEEWERVSTAFIAFRQGQSIVDPVELTAGLDGIDAFNMVSFESEDDVENNGSLVGDSLSITLITNSFEDTFITVGDSTFPVTGGQMIDVDTVIGFAAREIENTSDEISLQGLATFTAGLTIGLGYSPLANIDENATEQLANLGKFVNVEDRVVAIRNFDGTIGTRGVTSTMLNDFVVHVEDNGSLTDSHPDLAPDDIAAVTYLYPRSSIDIFFDLHQRVRTQALDGYASEPIAGAWVRAWCDADNNPGTARVPFTDTFTGLYEWQVNTDFRGHFELNNLIKQLETAQEVSFAANYTFSSSEFLPPIFTDDERSVYDTTHGGFTFGSPDTPAGEGFGFDTLFPAEVYFEGENLFGLQNVNQGTPLYFDLNTRTIRSVTSGKSLDTLLATGRPMFGDQSSVCPLNVVVAGLAPMQTPSVFRGLRDDLLLNTAAGTALVDAYYRAAPTMAQYLVEHRNVLAAARLVARGVEWAVVHAELLLLLVSGALVTMLAGRYLRRRNARAASALLLAGGMCLMAAPADALLLPYDISDYMERSSDVIHGDVTSVESYWTENNTQIVTDVTVCVKTAIKGSQNEGGLVHFQLPVGRVGAVGRFSPEIPNFKRGEEVVLFLNCGERGFTITGGVAGKYAVKADARSGKKYVLPVSFPGMDRLKKEAIKIREHKAAEEGVELASVNKETIPAAIELQEFVDHLRRVERERNQADDRA
ncbi:MAG: hypothetical protein AMXMBFR82_17290 [Candidatus Hydrogenedentota bacterium]